LAYRRLKDLLNDLETINILDFIPEASLIYEELMRQKIRIGTRDLRIAAMLLKELSSPAINEILSKFLI
jgi:tRNA(fMet)-specific endonuclease VapC